MHRDSRSYDHFKANEIIRTQYVFYVLPCAPNDNAIYDPFGATLYSLRLLAPWKAV